MGADGEVYAVSQGPIAIGGFEASGGSGSAVTKAVPTSGTISNGAIVEKETGFEFNRLGTLALSLKNPDITTAMQVRDAINEKLQGQLCSSA